MPRECYVACVKSDAGTEWQPGKKVLAAWLVCALAAVGAQASDGATTNRPAAPRVLPFAGYEIRIRPHYVAVTLHVPAFAARAPRAGASPDALPDIDRSSGTRAPVADDAPSAIFMPPTAAGGDEEGEDRGSSWLLPPANAPAKASGWGWLADDISSARTAHSPDIEPDAGAAGAGWGIRLPGLESGYGRDAGGFTRQRDPLAPDLGRDAFEP